MKKLFNSIFVIIAAMVTFAGCAKEEIAAPETKTVKFFAESIETKTAFGTPDGTTYPTLWTENDTKVKLALNLANNPKDATVEVSDDFKTASFETEITDDASGSYTYYALSPASAFNSFSSSNKYISANIPASQTPLTNSVDEKAQVLYAVSNTFATHQSEVSLKFKHFTAYGRLSFKNLELGDAEVASVSISSSESLAGRWDYKLESDQYSENSGISEITLLTTETSNIWFACAPVDVSGKTLEFTINTDKGVLTKEVTLPVGRKFEAGKIAKMAVDMSGVTFAKPKEYKLVTNVDELIPGSQIILAAHGDANAALSTTQNSNNRAVTAVVKSEDNQTISNPGNSVQLILLESGLTSGTFAFNVGNGYLYAASSTSNYLRTETTLSGNSSWNIEIAEDGKATIKATGTNTRNWLRYNSGNSMFSCYGSGQSDVAIYKLQESNYIRVSPNDISVKFDQTSATFAVSSDLEWTATPSAGATVTKDGNTVTVSFAPNTVEEEKTYMVTVSAQGAESQTVTITQDAWVDTSVIEELTVEEFLTKKVNTDLWYKLTGKISNINSTLYGNFNLTDETGTIYVYGLKENAEAGNQTFANLGLRVGDEVTLIGNRAEHNGNAQVGNAYYVSHIAAPFIDVVQRSVTVNHDDCTLDIDLLSNTSWTVTASTGAIVDTESGEGDAGITVDFAENTTSVNVTYTITISSENCEDDVIVTITQKGVQSGVQTETIEVTFSNYAAGTQYAENEEHVLGGGLTLYTTQCHFTTELRIYSSSSHNGYVVSNQLPGSIASMTFNAGNKVDNILVYGSTDGSEWNSVGKVAVTATSYNDYSFSFSGTNYTYFKLDVEGGNQVRLKTLSVTYIK